MGVINPAFGSIIPSQTQLALANNYLNFNAAAGGGTFAQQYLPDILQGKVFYQTH